MLYKVRFGANTWHCRYRQQYATTNCDLETSGARPIKVLEEPVRGRLWSRDVHMK